MKPETARVPVQCLSRDPSSVTPTEIPTNRRAERSLSHISPILYVTLISHQISTAPRRIKPETLQKLGHFSREAAINGILTKSELRAAWADEYFPGYFEVVQHSPTPALGSLDDGLSREKMPPGRNNVLAPIPTTFLTSSGFGHLFPKHLQNRQWENSQ